MLVPDLPGARGMALSRGGLTLDLLEAGRSFWVAVSITNCCGAVLVCEVFASAGEGRTSAGLVGGYEGDETGYSPRVGSCCPC